MTTARPFLVALFIAAPVSVLPLVDVSARLDLIDLYEAAMPARVENRYEGFTEMQHLSDTLVALKLTEISSMEFRLTADSNVVVRHSLSLSEGQVVREKTYNQEWRLVK